MAEDNLEEEKKTFKTFAEEKGASSKEVEQFLDILLDKITEIRYVATASGELPDSINFKDYTHFRDEMGECISFLIIIERHLGKTEEKRRLKLAEKFDELTVAVWSILLEGSLSFLRILSSRYFLPMGTKHVFTHELRVLYDAQKILKEPRLQPLISEEVVKRRNSAERILHEVIDRAPQLLQLT